MSKIQYKVHPWPAAGKIIDAAARTVRREDLCEHPLLRIPAPHLVPRAVDLVVEQLVHPGKNFYVWYVRESETVRYPYGTVLETEVPL